MKKFKITKGNRVYIVDAKSHIDAINKVKSVKDSNIKDKSYLTQVEVYKKSIIYKDDNGYYYHTPIGGKGAKAYKDNTKDIKVVKKRIDSDVEFLSDSKIKDSGINYGTLSIDLTSSNELTASKIVQELKNGIGNNKIAEIRGGSFTPVSQYSDGSLDLDFKEFKNNEWGTNHITLKVRSPLPVLMKTMKDDPKYGAYKLRAELNSKLKQFANKTIYSNKSFTMDSKIKDDGESVILNNNFRKIKVDNDWTSYQYNGSDFDNAVFKIHQYNPSLIAFVSNGNRTITVRNKYLNDAANANMKTAEDIIKKYGGNPVGNVMGLQKTRFVRQDEIKNQHDFAIDLDKAGYKFYLINGKYRISPKDSSIKDDLTMVEKYKKSIIYKDDNGYYYHTPIGGRGAKAYRDNTKDINIVKKRIDNDYSFLYDSAVKDVSFVTGKNLKVGQKIIENDKIYEVLDIKDNSSIYSKIVTLKDIKTGKVEQLRIGYNYLTEIKDKLIQSSSKEAFNKNMATEIKSGKDPKQAAAIAYSVQKANDSISQYKPGMDTTGLWQVSHIKNNINQSLLVRANSKEEAINKVVKHSPNSEIIGVNEYPIPHFGEPILDSGFVDAKDRFYKVGTKIKEGNNILVVVKVDDKYVYLKHPNGKTYAYDPYDLSENLKMSPKWSYVDSAIKDADPVEVEKIIRKEKSALGITYYLFQTKSKSGATIYYEVTDKTYHGEPTYSGGGVISFSLQSANDSLDSHLLYDKLVSKYGKIAGRKRFLLGKNDSAIKDKLSTSDANSLVEAYIDKYKYTHSNLLYVNKPEIRIFNSPEEFRDKFLNSHRGYAIYAGGLLNYNGYVVKLFTSATDGKIESTSSDNIFTIFPTMSVNDTGIKDTIVNKKFRKGAGSDIRALCIKNDWYTSGTISDYDKLLTGVDSGWTVNEAALDIAKHSHGVKPIDVVHAIEQYNNQRHFLQDSSVNDSWSGVRSNGVIYDYSNGKYTITHKNGKVEVLPESKFATAEELYKYVDNIKDAKPYNIKYKDKQYKVYAKDEQTAVEKLNNLLNKVTDEPIKWRTEDDPLYQDWKKDYQKLLHISIASRSAYAQYHDTGAKEQELKSYIDEYNKIIDKWKFGEQFKLNTKKEPQLTRLDTFKQSIQNRYNIKPKINGQY